MATIQEVLDSIAIEIAQIDAATNPMLIRPSVIGVHVDDARTLLEWAKHMEDEGQRRWLEQSTRLPKLRPIRIPIRPIADVTGGKFDAKYEIDNLKQTVRQLTDYVNELRRDVDRLQGYGE